jgi:hypothetical protein
MSHGRCAPGSMKRRSLILQEFKKAPRVHHAHRRRGGGVAARGASAASASDRAQPAQQGGGGILPRGMCARHCCPAIAHRPLWGIRSKAAAPTSYRYAPPTRRWSRRAGTCHPHRSRRRGCNAISPKRFRVPLADPDPHRAYPHPAAAAAAAASTAAAKGSHYAASAAPAAAASTATSAQCAAPAAAPSTASASKLHAFAELNVFFVEDIERRQVNVGDFLLTERDDGTRCVLRRCMLGRRCGRCAAREC